MNFDGDGKNWIKVNEVNDTRFYKWGPKAICDGEDYEVGAWGAPRMVYKWIVEMLISNGFHADN